MKQEKKQKLPPLERGLLDAMKAIDRQVEREMQRTPAEREQHGVQKWEPYRTRIEKICELFLNSVGDEEFSLDSILVLAQASAKSLSLLVEDLEEAGLGNVRTRYCLEARRLISHDMDRIQEILKGSGEETLN